MEEASKKSGSPRRTRALCGVPVASSCGLVTEQATKRGKESR